jgi:hypothetical protein
MRYDQFQLNIDKDNKIEASFSAVNREQEGGPWECPLGGTPIEREFIAAYVSRLKVDKLSREDIKLLGKALYQAIFPLGSEIRSHFEQAAETVAIQYANGEKDRGLRLHITINEHSLVARWPLEFLYDARTTNGLGWLGTSRTITLSRRLGGESKYSSPPHGPPLNVLVVVSIPKNGRGAMSAAVVERIMDWANEQATTTNEPTLMRKRSASASRFTPRGSPGKVKVMGKLPNYERVETEGVEYLGLAATWENLVAQFEDELPDVLHFIGHGEIDGDIGYILLVSEEGTPVRVRGEDIANLISDPTQQLRLVVLQACESAASATGSGFMSVATYLHRHNIPAVLAMQFEITNEFAIKFAMEFYKNLAEGQDVDTAVQQGRWKLGLPERYERRDFGTPVLFMISPYAIIMRESEEPRAELYLRPPTGSPVAMTTLAERRNAIVARYKELAEEADKLAEEAERKNDPEMAISLKKKALHFTRDALVRGGAPEREFLSSLERSGSKERTSVGQVMEDEDSESKKKRESKDVLRDTSPMGSREPQSFARTDLPVREDERGSDAADR